MRRTVGDNTTEKPAVEGGEPVRETFLPFCKPTISSEEIEEVIRVLESGWLTSGPKVLEFEEMFKDYVGCSEAVAVNSCTAGLLLSLLAFDVGSGDEVITSPLTFPATANVIVNVGATPVFADIDEETMNIHPDRILEGMNEKTKAIIPVHYAGNPCDMKWIMELAEERNVGVIEDAAHAVGAEYGGKRIGSIGTTTSFSFYATKNMTTGEGGMTTTNQSDIANKIRTLRQHGIDQDAWKRHAKGGNWYYEVKFAGQKCNMTDLQAAMGLVQLKKLNDFNDRRRGIADELADRIRETPEIRIPVSTVDANRVWHLFPILVDIDSLSVNRDEFVRALLGENIGVSVHFIPLYGHPFYRETYGFKKEDFPVTEWAYERLLSLPIYPDMSEKDVDDVAVAVEKVIGYYRS